MQVFTGLAQVLADTVAAADGDCAVFGLGVFLHDDGVGACRHHAAGHDAHGLAGSNLAFERHAGKRTAGDLQADLGIDLEVGKAQGKTVHRRVVM